jgi:hypothetical protein
LHDRDESFLVPDATADPPLKKFASDEMVTCDACLRANAPTRAQCLYCGASLHQTAASSEVETAAVEETAEKNHYVVVCARDGQSIDDAAVAQLAEKFQLKPEELHVALSAGAPLPLASTFSEDDATRIISDLKGIEMGSATVSAVTLNKDDGQTNIRALEFDNDNVTAISKIGRQRLTARLNDIQLVVTGRLLMHRVEVDERRSRSAVKSLDRRELSQDQSLLDLYLNSSEAPWRIMVNDFDFSCLGERKGLTAFDNVRALVELLKDRTPAQVNDSYARIRPVLANVWPLQNTASQSRSSRPRAGRNEFSTVTASDNETQFNNYSRLAWCLKRRNPNQVDESKSD